MKDRTKSLIITAAAFIGIIGGDLGSASAGPTPFADPAFQKTWERTDSLVAAGKIKRSFYWGLQANTGALQEDYAEGPGGKHLVQYFDKSRMEINNPNGNKNDPFYVTNGLLTVDLIKGRMQIGNSRFVQRWHAHIPLASDTDDPEAPTYASFQRPVEYGFTGEQVGQVISTTIKKIGETEVVPRFASYGVKNVYMEKATERPIPSVFWDFLNQSGPVMIDGKQSTARLSDPYFYATGYPISQPLWASVKIAGKPNTDVLIQAFERRVLTYVPSAPEGFKVQMGNIGQHYYDWRYKDAGKPGPAPFCKEPPAGGIGKLWSENLVVQNQLLCREDWQKANIQVAHFERGHAIYVSLYNPPQKNSAPTTAVYVFTQDGNVKTYIPDITKPDDPNAPTQPPTGLFRPEGEPGRLWRQSAEVRQLLGWATAPVKDVRDEEKQFFQRGLAVADGGKIYLFYNEAFYFYAYAAYWAEYTNTQPIAALTPVTGCAANAPGELGKLWSANLVVQNRLRCAENRPVNVALQPFQFGSMIYMDFGGAPTGNVPSKVIYAIYRDGTAEWFADTYQAGEPEPTPIGPQTPRLGFGKVWREKNLVQKLGFATAVEEGVAAANFQLFARGAMLRNGNLIYSLFSSTPGNFADIKLWSRYGTQ